MQEKRPIIVLMAELIERCDNGQMVPPYAGKYKKLLDEIADRSMEHAFWRKKELEAREFTRGMSVQSVWMHMLAKIAEAPTPLHQTFTIVGLAPILRERIAFQKEMGSRRRHE